MEGSKPRADQPELVEPGEDTSATEQKQPLRYTNDEIPESRRAVGKFIKGRVLQKSGTIKQFIDTYGIQDHSKLNRVISGRKKIDPKFAPELTASLGESDDFWLTLEHKILANLDTYMPDYVPPEKTKGGGSTMAGRQNEFNDLVGLSPEQIYELRLARDCLVLGEGTTRMTLPKDTPPEIVKIAMQVWYDNQSSQRKLQPAADPSNER